MSHSLDKNNRHAISARHDHYLFGYDATDEMEACRLGIELRSRIESFGTGQAAKQARLGADTKPILDAFFRLSRINLLAEPIEFAEADLLLHREILLLSKIPSILESWQAVLQPVNRFREDTLHVCWPDSSSLIEAHRVIVDAVSDGQAELAEELAKRHLEQVWSRIAILSPARPVYEDPWERACVYIMFHYHENITLQELATTVAGVSVGHLARLFRNHLGKSFTSYLREIRMKKSAYLLLGSHFSIGQIARLVGYSDLSRFSQHFRAYSGVTPSHYRLRQEKSQ